ncbi:hypothetical protein LTR56_008833 [Elasticomyces elasticus]|nr:hypothetical protein LTR22_015825 [Elasticomyces elasticus]KAK3645955.1 hypothetical protein LTR56_008833 [Elasticomyces elasticus]KAK4914823.1 hypothetical protein LTR49_016935 [Elasticomyces elasticus]
MDLPYTSTSAVVSAAVPTAPAAVAYGLPDALPTTHNQWIAVAGGLALYNSTLLLVAAALLQHTAVFGILFLLRGFSPKRALDLHYLTIVFALSFVAAPIVFLVDLRIDQVKLLFFLEHEAVEFLIAIRVLAPAAFVARRSGLIVLVCWCALVAVTVPVVLDEHFHHAADIVAWSAFASDFLVGISGLTLVQRWKAGRPASRFEVRKLRAEAMAGLGFMLHGFITMSVGPIFALVLYRNLNPVAFAYAWVAVFFSAFFAVGFAVPVAGIFFNNIRWCISHRKAVFPGQVEWYEEFEKGEAMQYELPQEPTYAPDTRGQRSPNEAWREVQLSEERSAAWQSGRLKPQQRESSNIYYRDVLKDLLAR